MAKCFEKLNRLTSIYKSPNFFVKVNEARLSSTVSKELDRGKGMAAIPKYTIQTNEHSTARVVQQLELKTSTFTSKKS